MSSVVDRFLNYVRIDTQSDPSSETVPSTAKQKNLSLLLVDELKAMGINDAELDEFGIVYATIPATVDYPTPVLGLIAHVDTAPAVSGTNVQPRIVAYQGGDIVLNEEQGVVLSATEYPEMEKYKGQELIVTDGTTLLGADDKAGVAEIMAMAATLMADKSIPHGVIRLAFTPDEEIGRGADHFDVKRFGADFAYTVDGGPLAEIEYENFNAASATLHVQGVSIHPGSAKGKMKNALLMVMEFQQMLPVFENPASTSGYEGFYHLDSIVGSVESATAEYIIRDHDRAQFEARKERILKTAEFLNEKYGADSFKVDLQDQYYNMKEKILPYSFLIDNAAQAMEEVGLVPRTVPIRGGTDGAHLSYEGLPCPNLCTGGHNYHGRFEYIPVPSLEKIAEILVHLVAVFAKKAAPKA